MLFVFKEDTLKGRYLEDIEIPDQRHRGWGHPGHCGCPCKLHRPSPAPILGLGQVLESFFSFSLSLSLSLSLYGLSTGPVTHLLQIPYKSAMNDYIYLKIAKGLPSLYLTAFFGQPKLFAPPRA